MFIGSTDAFSAPHTSRFLVPFLRWLNPNISFATLESGESEIWWFSLGTVKGETKDDFYVYSFAPVEMRRGGTNYTYACHNDGLNHYGSFWCLPNASGDAAERYEYEDFGDPHFMDGSGTPLPSSAIGNPYLFKGMRFDGESGLYLCDFHGGGDIDDALGSRPDSRLFMFDPKIGASLQRESSHAVNVWQPGSVHLYTIDPKITERDARECMQIPIM